MKAVHASPFLLACTYASLHLLSCDVHVLQYQPRKGDALLFWTFKPDGTRDEQSLHGACPVTSEDECKWVATKWLHQKPVSNLPAAAASKGSDLDELEE